MMKKQVVVSLAAIAAGMAWGASECIKVSSLGYDPADSTRFIQQALDSGARRVILDRQAGPWVTRPVFARSNTEIIIEPHTTLLAKRGAFLGLRDYLFSIINVTNVTLRGGEGATFRMWRDDYFRPPYEIGDWRYALSIRGAKNVLVEDVRCEFAGGDGICIAENASDVTLRRCVCDQNARQALTIGSGSNILVEDCVFSNTHGRPPQAGVDIEPDSYRHHLDNIVLRNCLSIHNAGSGYEIAPNTITPKSRRVNILLDNCRAIDNLRGVAVFGAWKKTTDFAQGCVRLKNCLFAETRSPGICIKTKPANMLDLIFEDCVVSNTVAQGMQPDVDVGCYSRAQPPPDGITFRNLRVFQNKERPWFAYGDLGTGERPTNITGNVTVTKCDGRCEAIVLDEAWRTRNLRVFNGGKPFKPLANFDAASPITLHDACPGKAVALTPVAHCFNAPFLFYMAAPGTARFTARQVIAAAGRAPSTNAYEIIALDGTKQRWTLPPVMKTEAPITFAAPRKGFYRLTAISPGTRIQMMTANVPVALDLTRGERTLGAMGKAPFSVWFEAAQANTSPTLLAAGSSYHRFNATLFAPDGKAVATREKIDAPECFDLSASAMPGLWHLAIAPSKAPVYDWVLVEAAGAPDCLFLSSEKYWLRH